MRNRKFRDRRNRHDAYPVEPSHIDILSQSGEVVINQVTVNNVTNITSVGGIPSERVHQPWRKHHKHRHKQSERKPELLRYCQSCGILDQHKVAHMSNGQLAEGAVDVIRYSSKKMCSHVEGAAKGFGGAFWHLARIVDRMFGNS